MEGYSLISHDKTKFEPSTLSKIQIWVLFYDLELFYSIKAFWINGAILGMKKSEGESVWFGKNETWIHEIENLSMAPFICQIKFPDPFY